MQKATAVLPIPWFPWIGKWKRPFYGWVVVAAASIPNALHGLASQGFATYLVPLQQEFGWSRAILAGPRSVTQVESAVLGPIEGYVVDRFGPRAAMGTGCLVMGAGLIMFGVVDSLWTYFLANILIVAGSGLSGILVGSVVVNHWFRRRRTLAQSIFTLGFAGAGIVGVPILIWTQATLGWRASAIASGLVVWAVGIPASFFLRRSPEPYGLLPDGDLPDSAGGTREGASAEEHDFTLAEAMRTRSFWLLAIGQSIAGLGASAVGVHLFLHLEQGVGLSRGAAALVWTVASLSNLPARLAVGFLGDHPPKHIVLGTVTALVALSHFVLGLATSLELALVYAVLYGIGWGARTPVASALQGEYFGRKSQGVIRGWLQSLHLPFTIAAPVVAGLLADVNGDYRLAFTTMSLAGFVGAACMFFATAPKPARA